MNNQLDKAQVEYRLQMQAIQLQTHFVLLLAGVESATKRWEIRHKWGSYRKQIMVVGSVVTVEGRNIFRIGDDALATPRLQI